MFVPNAASLPIIAAACGNDAPFIESPSLIKVKLELCFCFSCSLPNNVLFLPTFRIWISSKKKLKSKQRKKQKSGVGVSFVSLFGASKPSYSEGLPLGSRRRERTSSSNTSLPGPRAAPSPRKNPLLLWWENPPLINHGFFGITLEAVIIFPLCIQNPAQTIFVSFVKESLYSGGQGLRAMKLVNNFRKTYPKYSPVCGFSISLHSMSIAPVKS
mgnify:CR=1 FL=1